MPLYEYACDACNHRFERRHGFNEVVSECPQCSSPVRKVLHAAGVVFKGSGWYITDTRKSDSESSATAEKKSDATETKTTETKTESKPEPAADSKPAEPKQAAAATS